MARQQRGCEAGITLSQIGSVYFIQMMKTPSRDRRLICDDDSESIRSTAKAEMHQKNGVNIELLIGSIGCTNKELSHSGRREVVVSGDFEASLPRDFTV